MTPQEPVAERESDREKVIDLSCARQDPVHADQAHPDQARPHQAHPHPPRLAAARRDPAAEAAPEGLVTRAVRAFSAWLLRVELAWETVRLPKLALPAPRSAPVTVGREADCSLVLATDPTVSRRHADLCWIAGHWVVADLHSSNGTWVNGARIVSPTVVRVGDLVAFGRSRFVLTADTRVARLFRPADTTTGGHLRAVG